MALIIRGKTECPLCREVIAADDDIVATSHFIADPRDSLWQYSDAAFHRRCFASWERRDHPIQRRPHGMERVGDPDCPGCPGRPGLSEACPGLSGGGSSWSGDRWHGPCAR